ncbi:HET-domain-containing protein [Clathrospora elynae]|uniref:HET-domain-containing protein n=1 Tax=Clathrospora elynae TaxID=706981 RepID=A0A6A5T0E2_9PLEO|nr:HET-domain-containing protein [Clathrospora elynae]
MRLIEAAYFVDAARSVLRTFNDESQLPPYAILSHTWGDEEVTLQDLDTHSSDAQRRSRVRNMSGYWKITKACRQALTDGIAFIWVDTCCIDKSSSAELSEAINSMFRWYQMAEVCYAYLDDVEVHLEAGVDGILLSDERFSVEELAKAKWFTRGWTLQELIAPNEVVFYGQGWKYIDTKTWLKEVLERITGISEDVLQGTELEDESISKRMSWMARRHTTRVEDLAYSLMGIFNVNMPLLYGEGHRAFVRLQEEIMKDSDDHSLFAWSSTAHDSENMLDHSSVFATHPDQFAQSGGIGTRRLDDDEAESYALTNKGVRIQLRISPYKVPTGRYSHRYIFLAVLDCRYDDPTLRDCRPAIIVEQPSATGSQLVRISNAGIVPVSYGLHKGDAVMHMSVISASDERTGPETVYLCKKVPGRAQFRHHTTNTKQGLALPY